jgi:predicted DNA-binding transcriptional regulator YafY
VNRTDRLYALVEELRAVSPRCRSARELSARLEVSVRTIERDISALQQAGVPIYADIGSDGGYALAKPTSLHPLAFTPAEAVAIAVVLSQAGEQPFAADARSALRKLVAAMPVPEGQRGREPASRVPPPAESEHSEHDARAAVSRVIEDTLRRRRVLRLVYEDRSGVSTERDVEPGVFIGGRGGFWYLVAWCRLREDVRVFRLDRIISAALTGEQGGARRQLEEYAPDIPDLIARDPALD